MRSAIVTFFQKAVKPNTFLPFICWLCALLAYSTDTYGFLKTFLVQLMRTGTQDNILIVRF